MRKENIGIVVLCTNAYIVLGARFINRFMKYYKGDKDITFYVFCDRDIREYLPENIDIEYFPTHNSSWVDGTNLKFTSILRIKEENKIRSDYFFYFDSDTNISVPFTEEWFLGDSVAGQHFGDQGWMKEVKGFERNPRSMAYVPYDTPHFQVYTYGAFWGGTKEFVLNFCKTILEWQRKDKSCGFEPGTNDESYSNKYFHYNPPTKLVKTEDFAFGISDKGGIGEPRDVSLNVSHLLEQIKEHKEENWNLWNGKFVLS